MNRSARRRAAQVRERWLAGLSRDTRVDDDTFLTLAVLSTYADENGEVRLIDDDGTEETFRLRFPWEWR